MAVTNYYTFTGAILAEEAVSGTGLRTYGDDALGSVVATYDNEGLLQNSYRYSPFGAVISETTPSPSPFFLWIGSLGYYNSGRSGSEFYVRARHYSNSFCRWTTLDPLWPDQPAYRYPLVPGTNSDPSGLWDTVSSGIHSTGSNEQCCCCPQTVEISKDLPVTPILGHDYTYPCPWSAHAASPTYGDWAGLTWYLHLEWTSTPVPPPGVGSSDPMNACSLSWMEGWTNDPDGTYPRTQIPGPPGTSLQNWGWNGPSGTPANCDANNPTMIPYPCSGKTNCSRGVGTCSILDVPGMRTDTLACPKGLTVAHFRVCMQISLTENIVPPCPPCGLGAIIKYFQFDVMANSPFNDAYDVWGYGQGCTVPTIKEVNAGQCHNNGHLNGPQKPATGVCESLSTAKGSMCS